VRLDVQGDADGAGSFAGEVAGVADRAGSHPCAGPGVKRTKAEIEELLKAGTNVKTLPVSGVAKALGIEVDKFEAHVRDGSKRTGTGQDGADARGHEVWLE